MKLEVDLAESVTSQLEIVAAQVWEKTFKKQIEKETYPVWMNLQDTSKYLGVSRSNLSRFIKDLDLPVSIIGKTKRCNRFSIDQWMKEFEV